QIRAIAAVRGSVPRLSLQRGPFCGPPVACKEVAMYGSMLPLLTEFMKPDVVAKMASGAGISDVASAQKTISGAVPAVLSGLAGVAAKPEGARQLSAAIAGLPSNFLEDLAEMIGGPGQLTGIGTAALTKLFSSTTLDTLASTLARFGGIGEGPARALL